MITRAPALLKIVVILVVVILEEFVLNVYVTTEMASVLGFMEFSNLELHETLHCLLFWFTSCRGAFLTIAKWYFWNFFSY